MATATTTHATAAHRTPRQDALRLGAFLLVVWLLEVLAMAWMATAPVQAVSFDGLRILSAEAVAAAPDAAGRPPRDGATWRPVTLPDRWTDRWPGFDGSVWYRLHIRAPEPFAPLGLLVDGASAASVGFLNGVQLWRDERLVEPLSLSFNRPRRWMLDAPLLRADDNVLLVRVAGIAADSPGLGRVRVGPPQAVEEAYHTRSWQMDDLKIGSMAVNLFCAVFFGTLWLFRREDAIYGWFAICSAAWGGVEYARVVPTPWPFPSLHALTVFRTVSLVLCAASFSQFVFHLIGLRRSGVERFLWHGAAAVAALLGMCLWQAAWLPPLRSLSVLLSAATFVTTSGVLVWHAWRTRRTDLVIVSTAVSLLVIPGCHDALAAAGYLPTGTYYMVGASLLVLGGMALALGWRLTQSLALAERFNEELQVQVDSAQAELDARLAQQRELEVRQARDAERLNLLRDLHDGLGGALLQGIAELEAAPRSQPTAQSLAALHQARDELRLVIDSSGSTGDALWREVFPAVRHRLGRALETRGIAGVWHCETPAQPYLERTVALDLLRLLQEALTNVVKHSGAARVLVRLRTSAGQGLVLEVSDDGVGMTPSVRLGGRPGGIGLGSMRHRAERLGGRLQIGPNPDGRGTRVRLELPCRNP